ncbi:zinc finger protein 546 [Eupeodes corollae]|uniref:zinc finger protein 546 n=1 Tax=Eupeodes corollae TaxID=290404 RepID=UPI0024923E0C|nr:zinc finger protein 546 [Eupeodes corollae]
MLEEDLDDTHLCIKCSATIVGLDNYVQHRKTNCVGIKSGTRATIVAEADDTYGGFEYPGASGYVKNDVEAVVGGKTSKTLNDPYDLPYELGADVFFSSLQLQSVQASGAGNAGKTSSIQQIGSSRKVANSGRDETEGDDWQDVEQNNSDSLMKVVRDIGETKKYEAIFQPIAFSHGFPEAEQSDDEDEDIDEFDEDDDDDEDYVPTPYSGGKWKPGSQPPPPRSGGKWKGKAQSQAVPSSSGGKWHNKFATNETSKWKPYKKFLESDYHQNRPKLLYKKDVGPKVDEPIPPQTGSKWKPESPTKSLKIQQTPLSGGKWQPQQPERTKSPDIQASTGGKWKLGDVATPSTSGKWKPGDLERSKIVPTQWDEPTETWEDVESGHPPVEHTKGKWVPGTKFEKPDYKDETIPALPPQDYWCNICCRKLKTKTIFDKHLKSAVHLKKSETEEQLERAGIDNKLKGSSQTLLQPTLPEFLFKRNVSPEPDVVGPNKRKRRKTFVKCDICKHRMQRYLMGKHLISHYHYVRRRTDLAKSYGMVLDNIHQIVLQSPFQCSPCKFYANDEERFLNHWNSVEHRDRTEGPGRFWCSFCQFECEDNNQMRRHLLGSDHREVIMAINRSVPIIISKKVSIECLKCHRNFRYNVELRQHALRCEEFKTEAIGTASDEYQSRFRCALCPDEVHKSKMALQRHEKFKHNKRRFYCSICNEEFNDPEAAIKHRKTKLHRQNSNAKLNKGKMEGSTKAKKEIGDDLKCEKCHHVSTSEVEAMLHQINHPQGCKDPKDTQHQEPKKNSTESSRRKCSYCTHSFATKSELKAHLNTIHPEMKHICPLCGEAFTLPQELGSHRRYKICVASTSKKPPPSAANEASSPSSQKDPKKSWNCSDCTFSSAYESELIFHRIIHSEGGLEALESSGSKIKCQLCEKSFPKHSLRHHLRQHTNEKIFQCEICKRSFSRRHNYKEHMEYVHSVGGAVRKRHKGGRTTDERFICDTCGKIFRTKYSLKLHINIHTERDKKFVCPVENCQYIGRNSSALSIHSSSHEVKTEFKCQEMSCNYQGKSAYHLKRHMKSHLVPEKLYKCPECDFKAKIPAHIRRHVRVHTGERPYKCPHCDYSCGYIENLRKHILTTKKHPGKFIYQCQECDPGDQYKTNYNNEFQLHLTKVHGK